MSTLLEPNASHVFGILWNGFQMLRCETACPNQENGTSTKKPHCYLDSGSLNATCALEGLCQMLERGKKRAGPEAQLQKLSISNDKGGGKDGNKEGKGDEGEKGGGKSEDGEKGGRQSGDRSGKCGRKNGKDGGKTPMKSVTKQGELGKGKGQENIDVADTRDRAARMPFAALSPFQLLANQFASCENDPVAGLLGPRYLGKIYARQLQRTYS